MKLSSSATKSAFQRITLPGYVPLYQSGTVNVCPCCGQRQWFIGRTMAECAFCDTALPISHGTDSGHARRFTVFPQAA